MKTIVTMKTNVGINTLLTAAVFTTLAAVWGGVTGTSDLPHPWLSLDRTAKVLHLLCKPPPEAYESGNTWQAVHNLRLFAFLPRHTLSANVSLVNMTSIWNEPRTNPEFSISRASFQGSWTSKLVSLEFVLPVTDKDLGRYFCVVDYIDDNDKLLRFSAQVVVDKDFVFSHVDSAVKNELNFAARVVEAHQVRVTWTKPSQPRFREASVSRVLAGDGGKSIAPSFSLFTTDGNTDYTYGSEVLLTKVSLRDGSSNMSITLYVEGGQHGAAYRYSCRVPYFACMGHNTRFCTCCQQGSNPDRQMCPRSPTDGSPTDGSPTDGSPTDGSPKDCGTFCILFVILLLVFILTIVAIFLYRRCPENACLQNIFTPTGGSAEHKPQYKSVHQHDGTRPVDVPTPADETTSHAADPHHEEREGTTMTLSQPRKQSPKSTPRTEATPHNDKTDHLKTPAPKGNPVVQKLAKRPANLPAGNPDPNLPHSDTVNNNTVLLPPEKIPEDKREDSYRPEPSHFSTDVSEDTSNPKSNTQSLLKIPSQAEPDHTIGSGRSKSDPN
ncbi:hypothetical protein ACOMHN_016891 [Nucella lapillus]